VVAREIDTHRSKCMLHGVVYVCTYECGTRLLHNHMFVRVHMVVRMCFTLRVWGSLIEENEHIYMYA